MAEQKPPRTRPIPPIFLILGISFVALGMSGGNDTFLWAGIAFLVIAIGTNIRQIRNKKK
jgi:membrane protein implicated in regulation of membrane protease activity